MLAFYLPDGDGRFTATELTRGPWDADAQHAGPPAALLARAIEARSAIDGGQTVRLSYDILRPVPVAPVRIEARTLRPGRRVEQLEATLSAAEDPEHAPLMRVTAWRMRAESVGLPDGVLVSGAELPPDEPAPPSTPLPRLPPPDEGRPGEFGWWKAEVAYHRALDWRFLAGSFEAPGPATVWTRLEVPLIAGEPASPLQRLLVMADAASGVSAMLDWAAWSFVNVDLGIHLERPPRGEWMAMAAETRLGPQGAALCTSVLYDEAGRVGASTHSLLVARLAG